MMSGSVDVAYCAETSADCGLCWKPTASALFVKGLSRPSDYLTIQLNICDECLLKLFNAVPLLSWAMRETMLQEAIADLGAAG